MHPRLTHLASFIRRRHDHHHPDHHHGGEHARRCGRRGHRGFQGFGSGPGQLFGGDSGRSGIAAGRKLTAADLQLLILSLLAEKPQHGYEIIRSLGERSNGYYTPSPGMVYPALTYLDEIGHAEAAADGNRKSYTITRAGIAHLEANRAAADTLLEQLAWIGQRMAQVRQAFEGGGEPYRDEHVDAPRGGRGRRGDTDFGMAVRVARRDLEAALIAQSGADAAHQQRIAAILAKAAREIRGQ